MLLLVTFFLYGSALGAVIGATKNPGAPATTAATSAVAVSSPVPTTAADSTRPIVPSTVTLLRPTTTGAEALANWYRWNNLTEKAWDQNFYDKHKVIIPKTGAKSEEISRRQSTGGPAGTPFQNWFAYNFNINNWGYLLNWAEMYCYNNATHHYKAGIVMKSVANEDDDPTQTTFKYWYNSTNKWTAKTTGQTSTSCTHFDGATAQCTDQIWDTSAATWIPRSGNYFTGWSWNNATYNGHFVRTIFDCLLNRVAVEYLTTVDAFGTAPVQYSISGMKYYRFYDENGFAWFAGCLPKWPSKNKKRQGVRGRNSNPVWDFGVNGQRNTYSDMTPFPINQITGYKFNATYTAMYWPPVENQIIQVEGDTCQVMALSRPGLRHWTARLIEIPPETWPPITEEQKWPLGWAGFGKFAWSYVNQVEFQWW